MDNIEKMKTVPEKQSSSNSLLHSARIKEAGRIIKAMETLSGSDAKLQSLLRDCKSGERSPWEVCEMAIVRLAKMHALGSISFHPLGSSGEVL